MSQRIEDYALLGDTRTAALVGRDGAVDWFCVPRFDSGAVFAALLGDEENGRWRIAPSAEVRKVERRYHGNSLILCTRFETDQGTAEVVDFLCCPPTRGRVDLVRLVRGIDGRVPIASEMTLRFDYGKTVPWVRRIGYGLSAVAGPNAVRLTSPARLEAKDYATVSAFEVDAGQTVPFALTWYPSHQEMPPALDPLALLVSTREWWVGWAATCNFTGAWREAVVRSLLTLKALSFAPTGGMVAAATTSLPEALGGERNWDYRYCWLRDSSFVLEALLGCGFREEAQAWRRWLLRAAAGQPRQLQIMYGLSGERFLPEHELGHLAGYAGSRPVRIGNAAHRQFQLDVYGELFDVFHLARREGLEPDHEAWALQRVVLEYLEEAWRKPDVGIWEMRGEPRHFTHSKVMAWVAFDRAVRAVREHGLAGPVERWARLRDEIHEDVCRQGFDADRGCFTQVYGGRELDASLLVLPIVGFLPPGDPRIVTTVEAIQRDLTVDGLVRRYRSDRGIDGLPGGEGVFLICSFWLAEALALLGRIEEAEALFERLLALRNDLGLLAEEYDPESGRQLGNFPQALSHVGLVHCALAIANLRRGDWQSCTCIPRPQALATEPL